MRVILVNPTAERLFEHPSLGLLYIASALRKAGHQVVYVEGSGLDLAQQIFNLYSWDPGVIGFNVMSPMFNEVKELINWIKRTSDRILIVAGGAHATLMPETLLEAGCDYVIQGEGEEAFPWLLERVKNGLGVANNAWRAPLIVDLDSLEFPARDLLPEKFRKRHSASIMASRGCPYNCSFCQPTLRNIFGSRVRRRSPDNVIREMETGWNMDIKHWEFFDDTFTADPKWLDYFLQELIICDHAWSWECLTRVNAVNESMLKAMKAAGCNRITFGVESGSQEILNFYGKGITVEQIREAFRLCHKVGIHTHALFMLGAPIETRETINATEQLIREIKPGSIFISITTPLPFTRLWDYCQQRYEVQLDWSEMNYYHKPSLKLEFLEADQIVHARERILKSFYLRHPGFVLKFLRQRGWIYFDTVLKNLLGGN